METRRNSLLTLFDLTYKAGPECKRDSFEGKYILAGDGTE